MAQILEKAPATLEHNICIYSEHYLLFVNLIIYFNVLCDIVWIKCKAFAKVEIIMICNFTARLTFNVNTSFTTDFA